MITIDKKDKNRKTSSVRSVLTANDSQNEHVAEYNCSPEEGINREKPLQTFDVVEGKNVESNIIKNKRKHVRKTTSEGDINYTKKVSSIGFRAFNDIPNL